MFIAGNTELTRHQASRDQRITCSNAGHRLLNADAPLEVCLQQAPSPGSCQSERGPGVDLPRTRQESELPLPIQSKVLRHISFHDSGPHAKIYNFPAAIPHIGGSARFGGGHPGAHRVSHRNQGTPVKRSFRESHICYDTSCRCSNSWLTMRFPWISPALKLGGLETIPTLRPRRSKEVYDIGKEPGQWQVTIQRSVVQRAKVLGRCARCARTQVNLA